MKNLKNLLFLFLLTSFCGFSQSYVFQEEFNSTNDWPTGKNDQRELNVYGGKYYFYHKREEKGWRISSSEFELNSSKDFEIETSITKLSGVSNYGITFMYDFKDGDNYRGLDIATDGHFRVIEYANGDYKEIKEWTKSSIVKVGNYKTNLLKVSKKGNIVTFYINGTYAYSMTHKAFMGKKVAINISRKQKIAIDYLRVKQLSSSTTITNNYKTKTILYDSFYSNRNNWGITDNENAKTEIKNSKYYFEYKGKKGWTTTKEIDFDSNRDFKIEASIQKISGIKNNGYGITFGRKDTGNQYQFLVTSNGNYSIDKYDNGKFSSIKDWTPASVIKNENFSKNTLKIEKRGNNYTFYINSSKVYSVSNLTFYGKRIGFSIFDAQKIAIDYLSISYLNENTNFNDNPINKGELLFSDNFSSNSNEWAENDDEKVKFNFYNGKYFLEHKRAEKGWLTYINKYFDSTKDFEIETKLDKISGDKNSPFGILWAKKDSNYFQFLITSTCYYKVNRIVNNKTEEIIKYTKSSSINEGNGKSNILKIRKEGEYYKFFINNIYVTKTDFEPFYGSQMGYAVYFDQKIAVDYLTVNALKSKNDNKNTIVNNKTLSLPLFDGFNGNTNGWNLDDADDYSVSMNNGKLLLYRKKKGGIFISRSVNIDDNKDFIIETSIARTSNSSDGLYGVTFGRKNSSNEYSFLLSGNGSYMYRKFDNDVYKKIIPFTESSAIKTGINQQNKIKIVKSGNLLRFYINGQYLNETAFEPFFGDKFGYTIYYDKKIAVDYLDIKYQTSSFNNPPVVVITSPNVEAKRGFKIVEAKKIQVRGKATDSDGIYEITVNGIEANVSEDGTFVANVPLKYGKNDLIVKATDIKQASSTKTFTIKRKSADIDNTIITDNTEKLDIGFGKYYALIIGVSSYEDKSIADLNGEPTKDAQSLADVLINKYSFSKENVTVLKNPKENEIIKEFYTLKKKVGKNDNLVIFYAGHGNYDKVSEKGYWMPSDANMEFEGNVILNTSIVSYIKSINSKHTLLIADACFSGSILTSSRNYKEASKAVQKKYALPSRKAITSGTLTTVPNQSVFMKYLLKRLNQNTDKYLSAGQLFNMIEDPVINNTTGDNQPQYAPISRTGDEGGDFIFIKRN
ncbi:caspase family protein [Polaribacter sp. MSW13]|uniref:Caspase family protein n=1 Tax=Polaribacter marinus TaxID=2916838 RepID=A0A9X2AJ55_9FLAO|nr:caspase family protein [Polaribacter marinus]MCI2228043.1 caspase family protein [Polaribacter marinus]